MIGFLSISTVVDYITSMHLHQCISYRYDDGLTDQLKDDWEFKDGVMVFSPEDDAMGFLFS